MKNHEGVLPSLCAADLVAVTTHHEVQLENTHQLTYRSNLAASTARVQDVLSRQHSQLATEINQVEQLPPPAPEVVAVNDSILQFIEATIGDTARSGIYGMPDAYRPTSLGFTTPMLGAVAIRPPLQGAGARQAITMKAALAHEYAHTTALPTRKIIVIDHLTTYEESGETTSTPHESISFGMQKDKISYDRVNNTIELSTKNYFFEEAFAEETASRYRAMLYTHNDTHLASLCEDGKIRSMSIRYFSIDERDPSRLCLINSTFAAHALHLLSEHSGTDLYDLLVLSRDPAYEVAAKRGIVQALESVDKGLYRTLRDMPYPNSSHEFYQLYDTIVALTKKTPLTATEPLLEATYSQGTL